MALYPGHLTGEKRPLSTAECYQREETQNTLQAADGKWWWCAGDCWHEVDLSGASWKATLDNGWVRVPKEEPKPNLGCATTRQLLTEIAVRGEVENGYGILGAEMAIGARNLLEQLPGSMLDYRTVETK